jgi:hypothetical protein
MARALAKLIGLPILAYAVLGAFSVLASSMGGGSIQSIAIITALPVLFFGIFILSDLYGRRQNPADALYIAKVEAHTIMLPRSQPAEEQGPPAVSGLKQGERVKVGRAQWLSANAIGVAMVAASLLWIATAYIIS